MSEMYRFNNIVWTENVKLAVELAKKHQGHVEEALEDERIDAEGDSIGSVCIEFTTYDSWKTFCEEYETLRIKKVLPVE